MSEPSSLNTATPFQRAKDSFLERLEELFGHLDLIGVV
jgi:hypothetical protein